MLRKILEEALRIHEERGREYGDTWKHMSIVALKSAILLKSERIYYNENRDKVIDDALDLINYSAMLIARIKNELG